MDHSVRTHFYTAIRKLYRHLPLCFRRCVSRHSFLRNIRESVKITLSYNLSPSVLYDDTFFSERLTVDRQRAYKAMAETIMQIFRPESVIDVGCGDGALLFELQALGVTCLGLDGSKSGVKIARERGLAVIQMDLRSPSYDLVTEPYSIALCLEVAEHLPASAAEKLVSFLCTLAPLVVFSAAQPGQGGEGHLNEQPLEYWKSLFDTFSFRRSEQFTSQVQELWIKHRVPAFYYRNLQIFEKMALQDARESQT